MPTRRQRRPVRRRIGRVSYYCHHGAWWVYYREGQRCIRRRVAESEADAERVAAQVNAQLCTASPILLAFTPVEVGVLRERFLDHHETVLRSSVSTVRRYRAATQHLVDFAAERGAGLQAHDLSVDQFAAFLWLRQITPNGYPKTARRKLRDKGVRFILEVCRSMYGYAQRMRHLPPYAANPLAACSSTDTSRGCETRIRVLRRH